MSNANVLCASEGVSQMNAGEKSLGVVIRAVSGGVILVILKKLSAAEETRVFMPLWRP